MVLKKRQPTFDSKPEGQKNHRSGDQMQRTERRHDERIAMVGWSKADRLTWADVHAAIAFATFPSPATAPRPTS